MKEQTFEVISEKLLEIYEAKSNVDVERYKFHSIKQKQFQTCKEFVIVLKKQANKCNFGESLNDMLRFQIIIGVQDECTR